MASASELSAMRRCLELAALGGRRTFPNPLVGAAVLDRSGRMTAEGYHERCGAPHAEAAALERACERAAGGTLVVSLEPCCHRGRTGPCTDLILRSGVARVVVAMEDPDPRVSGRGIDRLREAGLDVEVGVLEGEAAALNRVYLSYTETGRSWLVLKMAVSIDGRVAAADGSSRWITGRESRSRAHGLRASVDAVLTGAGTVRVDDPMLTARLVSAPPERQPAVIVVTGSGDLGGSRAIFGETGRRVVLAVPEGCGLGSPEGAEVWELPAGDGGVDLARLLSRTASEGMGSVLCEAGPLLATALLRQRLVNLVHAAIAPVILGSEGVPVLGELGIGSLGEAIRLRSVKAGACGIDTFLEGEVVHGSD